MVWFRRIVSSYSYYAEDLGLLENAHDQGESFLYHQGQVAGGIDLFENSNRMESMCLQIKQQSLKLFEQFTYPVSNISSTESDLIIRTRKA